MSGIGTKKNAVKASDADREEGDICPANGCRRRRSREGREK
jgi:hypothetical protein